MDAARVDSDPHVQLLHSRHVPDEAETTTTSADILKHSMRTSPRRDSVKRLKSSHRTAAPPLRSADPVQTSGSPPRAPDGVNHVDAHLDAALRVVAARLRQPRHAVVTVTEDLDAKAVVLVSEPVKPVKMNSLYVNAVQASRDNGESLCKLT